MQSLLFRPPSSGHVAPVGMASWRPTPCCCAAFHSCSIGRGYPKRQLESRCCSTFSVVHGQLVVAALLRRVHSYAVAVSSMSSFMLCH